MTSRQSSPVPRRIALFLCGAWALAWPAPAHSVPPGEADPPTAESVLRRATELLKNNGQIWG